MTSNKARGEIFILTTSMFVLIKCYFSNELWQNGQSMSRKDMDNMIITRRNGDYFLILPTCLVQEGDCKNHRIPDPNTFHRIRAFPSINDHHLRLPLLKNIRKAIFWINTGSAPIFLCSLQRMPGHPVAQGCVNARLPTSPC